MSLLQLFAILFLAQTSQTASIEGVVIQMGTTQPIMRAVVELTGANARERTSVTTSSDGKFEFRNLPAGRYRLNVSRQGYVDRRPVSLDAAQPGKDIRIALMPLGAIFGRVYDRNGEPMARITVQAMKYAYEDGTATLTAMRTDQTDDRGEYRLFWLPPGSYYVAALPLGSTDMVVKMFDGAALHGFVAGRQPATQPGEAYATVYYPGTPDSQAATSLEVRPGAEFGGIDFTLAPEKQRKIRGVVIDGSTGQPVLSAMVALVPRSTSITGALNARPSTDGTFQIDSAFPGSYVLAATARIDAGGGAVRLKGGRMPIEIRDSDFDRVVISLSPTVDIPGQIITEDLGDVALQDHHPSVTLKSDLARMPGRATQVYAQFNGNRQFVLNDAVEGEYQVDVSDLPRGTYVKSIRFGAADILNAPLRLESRSTNRIEIVLGTKGGVVDGVVVDKNRDMVPRATVALIPDAAHRRRGDLFKTVPSDASGRFHFESVAPGDYLMFAWQDVEEDVWHDPNFVRRSEASGRPLRIVESGRETLELIAIPFAY